jgi:hypothetical protein
MGQPSRRWYIGLATACVFVALAIAGGFVLVFSSGKSEAAPTKNQYFARVAAICRIYGPKLDKIPPPIDVSIPSELWESAERVLPILRAEADAVRRLVPPRALRAKLTRWIRLNDQSLAKLAATLPAAREKNFQAVQTNYVAFIIRGAKAQRLGREIGFPSPPC